MPNYDAAALFRLYSEVAPPDLFRLLQRQSGRVARNGIYSARLVIWMMMQQRLQPQGTLARSVAELAQGRLDALLSRCKRVRENHISLSTGGYCQARQRLPKLLVRQSMDECHERLRQRILEGRPALPFRAYLLDGSSLQLEHEPELVEAYPVARNQHGQSHWPVVRVVVAHDLETGLAERPYWGPMYGRRAVSEQALAEHVIEHLPAGSVVVADRNFGIFSTAYQASQRGQWVIVRLTQVRARALGGGSLAGPVDQPVRWEASRLERKKHPERPEDAHVEGRLIAWRVGRGKPQQWLYLFTTLELPAAEVVELYGRRWRVETDLRSLKQTVRLERLSVHSEEMLEKELLLGVMAYNLVRTIMFLAAQCAGIDPRQLSFSYARNLVLEGYPRVLAARGGRAQEEELDRLIELVGRCRLPKRTKPRSYPREVWGRGYRYRIRRREKN